MMSSANDYFVEKHFYNQVPCIRFDGAAGCFFT